MKKQRLILKFGGTSVANIERLHQVAQKIYQEHERNHEIVVVVSAMSGHTDQLISYCQQAHIDSKKRADQKEYDAITSTGEQVSAGLLAICLHNLGLKAQSFLGWQVPIITDNQFGLARIKKIETSKIEEALKNGIIPVVSGFQGVTAAPDNRITTIGRGGSDLTAVALAAAFHADRCDIYTDVDGVYSCDPRIEPKAHKISMITYDEMAELSNMGAKVMQPRSVDLAAKHDIKVQILSTFEPFIGSDLKGTLFLPSYPEQRQNSANPVGIALLKNLIKCQVHIDQSIPPQAFEKIFAQHKSIQFITEFFKPQANQHVMNVYLPQQDASLFLHQISELVTSSTPAPSANADQLYSNISIIGSFTNEYVAIKNQFIEILGKKRIEIDKISLSCYKMSACIAQEYTELAVRSLHSGFKLDIMTF